MQFVDESYVKNRKLYWLSAGNVYCLRIGSLMINLSDLKIFEKIATGTYGVVCKGDYLGTDVAIKMLNLAASDVDCKEVQILQ